jgi:hypothetical protein
MLLCVEKLGPTVPEITRKRLKSKAGNETVLEIDNEIIKLRKALTFDIEFSATLVQH